MIYKPKVGDHVRIKDYTGMFNPMTVYDIVEVRPDVSRLEVNETFKVGILALANYKWIENDQLIQVIKKPSN